MKFLADKLLAVKM